MQTSACQKKLDVFSAMRRIKESAWGLCQVFCMHLSLGHLKILEQGTRHRPVWHRFAFLVLLSCWLACYCPLWLTWRMPSSSQCLWMES